MDGIDSEILRDVDDYYSAKIREHGLTPSGVDWNGEESQIIRFQQLMKIVVDECSFSINDLGCGYGALLDYFENRFQKFSYFGVDVSGDMIRAAVERYRDIAHARFTVSKTLENVSDYSVASGIFNVRLKRSDGEWWTYFTNTLDMMNENSTHGFSFNCLTKYSDAEKKREYLYYADPCELFDWCKRRYSKQVALLHDYGLYEFTIIVRK